MKPSNMFGIHLIWGTDEKRGIHCIWGVSRYTEESKIFKLGKIWSVIFVDPKK
ncbi:MAG: hypothetical protein Ct9H90mP6_06980 [Gammaproteobacteria bacterium]|nr:MAG: hypothetical protein Ct9H90mP6_06980 [Gammaproteobacteria bacterium]